MRRLNDLFDVITFFMYIDKLLFRYFAIIISTAEPLSIILIFSHFSTTFELSLIAPLQRRAKMPPRLVRFQITHSESPFIFAGQLAADASSRFAEGVFAGFGFISFLMLLHMMKVIFMKISDEERFDIAASACRRRMSPATALCSSLKLLVVDNMPD